MQLLLTQNVGDNASQNRHSSSSFPQQSQSLNPSQISENFSSISSHNVKILSSQIPQFSRSEEDDVDLWLEKLESVAEIHNFSDRVKLSAATSRLTKTVRRWFDLCTGSVNRSWIMFRSALISRFKRKILYSAVMQKVEARRWIFTKESFSDYAMDKLAVGTSETSRQDSIQLLINGISNVAIKATAASLKIDSLDEFLRDMQHITATCNDIIKKSPSIFRKNKSKDQSRPSSPKAEQEKKSFCSFCHGRNHIKENCFKLNRKEQPANSTQIKKNVPSSTVASVAEPPEDSKERSL